MADRQEIEYFETDEDEFDIDVDNSAADFKQGWYAVEITRAPITQKVYDTGKYRNARVALKIVDDENFEGITASATLPLDSKGIAVAKRRKAFLNALAETDTGDRPTLKGEVRVTDEGTRIPQLAGVIGERLGAFLYADGNFVNVKDELFCTYADLETKRMELDSMDDF